MSGERIYLGELERGRNAQIDAPSILRTPSVLGY